MPFSKDDQATIDAAKKSSRKGIPNKTSIKVRDDIIQVFEMLGGADAMFLWALDNQTIFYRIYGQMLPKTSQALDAQGNETNLLTEDILGTLTDEVLARIALGEKVNLGKAEEKGASTRH